MFISNALVPVDTMPKILEIIAKINPVTHMVNAVKDLLIGSIFSQEIFISLILMIVVVIVFAPLTLKVYMKKQL
jgi:ABC-2 type transport system permease protein